MFLLPLQTLGSIANKFVFSRKYVVLLCGFFLHLAYGSVLTFGKAILTLFYAQAKKPNFRKHDDVYNVLSTEHIEIRCFLRGYDEDSSSVIRNYWNSPATGWLFRKKMGSQNNYYDFNVIREVHELSKLSNQVFKTIQIE